MIWRRTSSIDGAEEVPAGSGSPRRSQRILVLRMRAFRRCEGFVHHEVLITYLSYEMNYRAHGQSVLGYDLHAQRGFYQVCVRRGVAC